MLGRARAKAVASAMLIGMLAGPAHAQTTESTISGVVRDQSGGVLPAATVTIRNAETGVKDSLTTGRDGRYRRSQLIPGVYEVRGELSGFSTVVRRGIKLAIAQHVVIDLVLSVGRDEVVEVVGDASLLEATAGGVAGALGPEAIRDLPLNGRSWDQLLTLNAGTVAQPYKGVSTSSGFGSQFSVSGARPEHNQFTIDGAQVTGSNLAEGTPGGVSGQLLGTDGIREFKVLRNSYSAEYGKSAGGHVILSSRTGTNELHGSGLYFYRGDSLDSANFFQRGREPQFDRHQFGATLGGPLSKDRTFFFINYEGLRETKGQASLAVVPDENVRQGRVPDPRTPGRFLTLAVDPAVLPYFSLWPLPNGRNFGDGTAEFFSNPIENVDDNFLLARIDHRLNANDSLFASYTLNRGDTLLPQQNPRVLRTAANDVQLATLEHTHIFSSHAVNVARVSFTRSFFETDVGDRSAGVTLIEGQPMGNLSVGSSTGTTGLGGGGLVVAGGATGTSLFSLLKQVELADALSLVRGSHSLKLGGTVQHLSQRQDGRSFKYGNISFDGLEQFLTNRGRLMTFSQAAPGRDFVDDWSMNYLGFYVQDDWRAGSKLVLNLGLRYEFITRPEEAQAKVAVPGPNAELFVLGEIPALPPNQQAIQFTRRGGRSPLLENNTTNSFAPRAGFAWVPFGNQRTVVRGGGGIFYNMPTLSSGGLAWRAANNWPHSQTGTISQPRLPRPLEVAASFRQPDLSGVDPSLETPKLLQWNLAVQQELHKDVAVTAGYVGSRGYNLLGWSPANPVRPAQALPGGRSFYLPLGGGGVPLNRDFGVNGTVIKSDRDSWYHAMEVELLKRMGRGLRFKAAYTWSHCIDTGSGSVPSRNLNDTGGTAQDPFDLDGDRGDCAFDIRHAFRFNFTYETQSRKQGFLGLLLNDWQVNGIVSLLGGLPFTPLLGFELIEVGGGAQRPDVNPDFRGSRVVGEPDKWFDPSAFVLPRPGFLGNAGRNILRADGVELVDLSLFKHFRVGRRTRLQFRVEVFNLFDAVNLGLPDFAVFNANGTIRGAAGQVRATATDARQVQLGVKVLF